MLAQFRVLLVWDNFESVREMPDPRATPRLDDAGCAALKGFLEWVRDHSSSAILVTSRAQETWLGQVRRIGVGGLNDAEAAQYAGRVPRPYPAAQRRRERRSFGELLDWLDGHPLAMRLTLPRLDTNDPAALLTPCAAPPPPGRRHPGRRAGPRRCSDASPTPTPTWASRRGDCSRRSALRRRRRGRPGTAGPWPSTRNSATAPAWRSPTRSSGCSPRPGSSRAGPDMEHQVRDLVRRVPHPADGPGRPHLVRLTRQLGMPALEEAWQQVTGQPVPGQVRDYITSHQDEDPEDSA